MDLRFELETQALVSAISWEQGLESYVIKPFSINSGSLIDFFLLTQTCTIRKGYDCFVHGQSECS